MGRIDLHDAALPNAAVAELKRLIARLVDEAWLERRTDEEEEALVARIGALSPDPGWSDHIFWSNDYHRADGTLDVDRLVEKITRPQPVIYGDPPAGS